MIEAMKTNAKDDENEEEIKEEKENKRQAEDVAECNSDT